MAMKLGKIGRVALWSSPVVIVVGGFLAALPWLEQQNDTFVLALSAAVGIFVMGYAYFISYKVQRGMDEVEIASQGFAISRGWVWGATATVLLLTLPPVTNSLIDLANMLSTGSPDMSDRGAVRRALFFGFMLVVLVQLVCVVVASVIWWRRVGKMREES